MGHFFFFLIIQKLKNMGRMNHIKANYQLSNSIEIPVSFYSKKLNIFNIIYQNLKFFKR